MDGGPPSASVASFPDLGAGAVAAAVPAPASASAAAKNNAIDDLLGLETELSAIQASGCCLHNTGVTPLSPGGHPPDRQDRRGPAHELPDGQHAASQPLRRRTRTRSRPGGSGAQAGIYHH